MPYIAKDRRHAIVDRVNDNGITYIHVAAIQDKDELAFAVRFLMDHFLYKRSKVGGVNHDAARAVVQALQDAGTSFVDDVMDPQSIDLGTATHNAPERAPISGLGKGEITNPYAFI